MTRTKYQQLQPEEGMRIEIWKAEDVSLRAMARRLGRAPSTLMRELRRNATARGGYGAMSAQACRTQRLKASRPVAKLAPDGVLWGVVRHFLDQKWSPQEIS
ncbi:helix-turn-helix domain-containing protein, partial [Ralstonia sp. 25mfcol4.1]|uniref:helix-turn-helix domain-containing protein n=1 Tax=Ralstonia sp. 25mfcol4.1 TaxID=1761899 RepID=UPI00111388F1